MRVYLNNLRKVSKGMAIIQSVSDSIMSDTLKIFITMANALVVTLAVVKDFFGKEKCLVYAVGDGWICIQGGVGKVLIFRYMEILREYIEQVREQLRKEGKDLCRFCKETLDFIDSIAPVPYIEIKLTSLPLPEKSIMPINVWCLTCDHFIGFLIAKWIREEIMGDDFFMCNDLSCIFCKPRDEFHSREKCINLSKLESVRKLEDVFSSACYGVEPPEYVEMDGILKEMIEAGYLCEEHLDILKLKLKEQS